VNDTTGDSTRHHAWYTCTLSRDEGRTWSPPVRAASVPSDETQIAASLSDYGDYEGLAALDLGARLVENKTMEIGTLKETWTVLRDPEGNGFCIQGPDESSPRLLFQRREKSRPEHYPLHIELLADDREREVERLTAAGATMSETTTAGERAWTVMRDPDANPFCVE
jgi:glyoxalase superfamily protein